MAEGYGYTPEEARQKMEEARWRRDRDNQNKKDAQADQVVAVASEAAETVVGNIDTDETVAVETPTESPGTDAAAAEAAETVVIRTSAEQRLIDKTNRNKGNEKRKKEREEKRKKRPGAIRGFMNRFTTGARDSWKEIRDEAATARKNILKDAKEVATAMIDLPSNLVDVADDIITASADALDDFKTEATKDMNDATTNFGTEVNAIANTVDGAVKLLKRAYAQERMQARLADLVQKQITIDNPDVATDVSNIDQLAAGLDKVAIMQKQIGALNLQLAAVRKRQTSTTKAGGWLQGLFSS